MGPARLPRVFALAVVAGVLAWCLLRTWRNRTDHLMPLPWTAVVGTAALAVVVVSAGLPVRRWVRGRRDRRLDPLTAARTVVLAQAAAYGGALLIGWYGAQAAVILPDLPGPRQDHFVLAVAATLAAVAVVGSGLLVQRWCRLDPPEGQDPEDDPVDDER